tara:strand:+ start:741 stop:1556 length:816 start_codon:yes stop_codon:yes gene_type:complete
MKTNQPKNKFELLIDADSLLFSAAKMAETEVEWDIDNWTLNCDHKQAKEHFYAKVTDLIHLSKCSAYTLAFTDTKCFRYSVYPEYKQKRKRQRKPAGYSALKRWALEGDELPNDCPGRSLMYRNIEADDLIGILATEPKKAKKRVIYSIDKDLLTVPGTHLKIEEKDNFVHPLFLTLLPEEAYYNFLTQTLTGDSVDNYKGLPNVGPVSARKILDKSPTWRCVLSNYTQKGFSEEYALQMARLAKILHWGMYDEETNEVKLWNEKFDIGHI